MNDTVLTRRIVATTLAVAVLGAACALFVSDQRGRSEVRRTSSALAAAENHQEGHQAHLQSTQAQVQGSVSEAQALQKSTARTQTSLTTTNASISSTESGLEFGGFDISELNTCLGGVTQALDQVAVGQTKGALSSLGAASASCEAAKPGGG